MPTMKNGRVELRNIYLPEEVHPGDPFVVELECLNHAPFIINDPDGCILDSTPCRGKDGYCIEAIADVGGTNIRQTQKECLNLSFSGVPPNTERIRMELEAPDSEGQYNIVTRLRAPGSGQQTGTLSATLFVTSAADRGTQEPGDKQTGGTQLKGGRISFDGVVVPSQPMKPGRQFEIGLVSTNSASAIIDDPDGCGLQATTCTGTVDGYCIENVAFVGSGDPISTSSCLNLPFTGTGSNTETALLVGMTPQIEGEYTVEGYIETDNSGQRTDNASATIQVSNSASEPADGERYEIAASQKDDGDSVVPDDITQLARYGTYAIIAYAVAKAAGAIEGTADALNEPSEADDES